MSVNTGLWQGYRCLVANSLFARKANSGRGGAMGKPPRPEFAFDPVIGSVAATERSPYNRKESLWTVSGIASLLIESVGEHVTTLQEHEHLNRQAIEAGKRPRLPRPRRFRANPPPQ
jgi:hypothetical protein